MLKAKSYHKDLSKGDKLKANQGIYLDFAASTPVSSRVFSAMQPYFSDNFANPSSLHIPGQRAQAALDEARHRVAEILGASWKEIIFTASATESINMAIRGAVKTAIPAHSEGASTMVVPHIVTTNIEHSAVLNTCHALEQEGVEVTYLPVNSEGLITAQQVLNAIKENTVLVTIGYVNNEIGTIQPISEISRFLYGYNLKPKTYHPVFHTDAVQATNYLDINVQNLGVDMMTLSGHKIYGPKGVGVLYKKDGVNLTPIITGGPQERELRAGTENIAAIVGFSEALKESEELKVKENTRLTKLRNFFINEALKEVHSITLNGSREHRVANNINFCFADMKTEALIILFDEAGIYVSGGSACTSRTLEPSHVIEAIGKKKCAKSSLRFSLGRTTTKKDLARTIDIMVKLVNKY